MRRKNHVNLTNSRVSIVPPLHTRAFFAPHAVFLLDAIARAVHTHVVEKRDVLVGWYYDLELPCKLSDALPKLSKEQLIELGRDTQMKFSTSLRKSEMLTKIEAELPARIEYVFDTFDESKASLMRLVLSRRGALPLREVALSDGDLACFVGQGVFVVGRHDKENCLGVPLELMERFRQHDGLPYAERVAANTRWIAAVQGLVYHYGVISTFQTYTYLSLLFGKEVSFSMQPSFWGVLRAMQG